METVIINKKTGNIVPFRIDKNGEIVITSSDPRDNDESCYVTTWDEITKKNKLKYETA